ncbi:MAG: hypothetical protein DRJ66_05920 [Thermoprotei archaeon]|nr:MAG: hypothetical protein DRJ66_05920 [Thermoprotei archaeon]RLF20749.1 MAG: hypothetical protein DRZ82_01195 [Thermoprotei archaeon]
MVSIATFIGPYVKGVLQGIRYWNSKVPIQRIYVIYDRRRNAIARLSQINADNIYKLVSSALHELIRIPINMGSYEDVFSTLYVLIRYEEQIRKSNVLIDITGANVKVLSALFSLSHIFPEVKLYSLPVRDDLIADLSISVEEFYEELDKNMFEPYEIPLPKHDPLEISYEEEMILLILLRHGGRANSIRSLIEWYGEDPLDPAVKNKFSRLIKKLSDKGLIEANPRARTKAISLTELGRSIALGIKKFYKLKESNFDLSYLGFHLEKEYLLPS